MLFLQGWIGTIQCPHNYFSKTLSFKLRFWQSLALMFHCHLWCFFWLFCHTACPGLGCVLQGDGYWGFPLRYRTPLSERKEAYPPPAFPLPPVWRACSRGTDFRVGEFTFGQQTLAPGYVAPILPPYLETWLRNPKACWAFWNYLLTKRLVGKVCLSWPPSATASVEET